jgi:hypothetical protein
MRPVPLERVDRTSPKVLGPAVRALSTGAATSADYPA